MKKILNILIILSLVLGGTLGGAFIVDASVCVVAQGCTGVSSFTIFAPIFGGTITNGGLQSGTTGTSGQVLTSNGAASLPTFQNATGGGGLTVGTTTITSGTNGRIEYNNSGVLGELATNGTGNVSLTTSPTFVTPALGAATATSINGVTITGGSTPALTITGTTAVSGSNTGDQTITLTGNVTGSGTGSFATTIAAGAVTNAMLAGSISNANLANSTISGVALGGTLAALSATDSTLTFSGSYTGTGVQTVGLNVANANTWTGSPTISTVPLIISGNQSAAAWGTVGRGLRTVAASYNDSSTGSGTVTNNMINTFGIPTLTATSASITYTNAANVYIAGAPVAGSNATLTNTWALDVATGTSIFNGAILAPGSFSTATTFSFSANFYANGGTSIAGSTATASLLFGGATGVQIRGAFNGTLNSTLATGTSYANLVIGSAPVTTFGSGTHALLANLVVNPIGTIGNGGATVTNTATLYVNGASAGVGSSVNYGLWATGKTRIDLGSDATGDIYYRDANSALVRLPIGATGTHLVVAAGIPSWTAQTGVSNYTHTIFTPTTGQTITLINNQYNIVNPAGALLALTVNLPSTPSNNDVVYIKFTQTISTVTYANGTVVDGITAPTAGGLTVLTYDSGTTSWY